MKKKRILNCSCSFTVSLIMLILSGPYINQTAQAFFEDQVKYKFVHHWYHTLSDSSPEKRFQECSSGVKQRAALARSLLHNPELIILDEPTRSLDPLSALEIRDYIQRLAGKDKKTVILF